MALLNHSCSFCATKIQNLQRTPDVKFQPTTLRQQTMLMVAYSTFPGLANVDRESCPKSDKWCGPNPADELTLPASLIADIKRMHYELREWDREMHWLHKMNKHGFREEGFDRTLPNWTGYRCFLTDLHWRPNMTIDRKSTANMILKCNMGFDSRHEFLLAAINCLDADVQRLWLAFGNDARQLWSAQCGRCKNPFVSYWIAKCANKQSHIDRSLTEMRFKCLDKGYHDQLVHFWPEMIRQAGGMDSTEMKHWLDHAFHRSIENRNMEVSRFLWDRSPAEYHESMLSSVRCCGAQGSYYAFQKAVETGRLEFVSFVWRLTDFQQHEEMVLVEHAQPFVTAAERGYVSVLEFFWDNSNHLQRFVLLFEQACAAFRLACANGHLEVVKRLWQDASVEQRRFMISSNECDAVLSSVRQGRVEIAQYLWSNMTWNLKMYLRDDCFNNLMWSDCISVVCSTSAPQSSWSDFAFPKKTWKMTVIAYLFSDLSPLTKSQLMRALLFNKAASWRCLLEMVEKENEWGRMTELMEIFDNDEKAQFYKTMNDEQAKKCGILSLAGTSR